MPSPSLTLWIDLASGKLLSGWQSISYAPNPSLKQGDSIGVELHIIKNFLGGSFSEYEFSPSTAVTLAVGRVDTAPDSGTFKLNYGGDTTVAISAGATAEAVQTALNDLDSIDAEGGVVVTRIGNSYRIVWNTAATTTNTLEYSFNELYPSSSISPNLVKAGSPTQKQIYQVHIKQAPVANITSFVNQDQPVLSYSQIHAPAFAGDTKVWRVSISPQPKSGSMLLSFGVGSEEYTTNGIDINASAATVLSALNSTYSNGSWGVVKSGTNQWDISTTQTSVFNLTAQGNGIIPFSSKYGVLDLDTAEVEDLLGGDQSAEAYLEVQLETDGVKFTVIQQPITIINDLIDDANYTLVQWGDVVPADAVVRYDTAQSLTNAEKQQARDNIGVSNIDTSALTAKDVELEGRIGDLEGLSLNEDEYDAIALSDNPSSTNVLISQSALSVILSDKADLLHTHDIIDITGLSTALSGKASLAHTHIIADITGLQDELNNFVLSDDLSDLLDGKASVNHTHTEFDNLDITVGLSAPQITDVESITFSDLTSITSSTIVTEAPIVGIGYARQDAAWTDTPNFQSFTTIGRCGIGGPVPIDSNNALGVYDGNIVFSLGYGLAFGDGTTQTTAALPLTGGTLSGKLNLPVRTSGSVATINLGTVSDGLTVPSTLVEGDIFFHETDANVGNYNVRLAYTAKNFSGTLTNYSVAVLQNSNFFTQSNTISCTNNSAAGLAITQAGTNAGLTVTNSNTLATGNTVTITNNGTGNSLYIDNGTPDVAFTVNTDGRVGIGVSPDATAALTVDSTGIKFGTNAVVQAVQAVVTATGTYDKEIPITINGVNYRIPCRQV